MFSMALLKEILRLGRPKFLINNNILYTLGVVAADKNNPTYTFQLWFYIWMCLVIHAAHTMTYFFNEYYDYQADCANKNPSPWTGGSRVLVEGKMKPEVSLRIARLMAFVVLANVAIIYIITENAPLCITTCLAVFLVHGYSAWPLCTSRRGLGEATICIVLNVLMPLAGYQSLDPSPPFGAASMWPILLFLIPIQYVRMVVMNMADYEGDKIGDKCTLVVYLGMDLASVVHGVGMVLAYVFLACLYLTGNLSLLTFLLMLIPAPIGFRQIRNVFIRPWKYDNPFWSTHHNLLSMAMALAAALLSGGRPLKGTSWALVFPLALLSISGPVFLMKIIDATRIHYSSKITQKIAANGKGE